MPENIESSDLLPCRFPEFRQEETNLYVVPKRRRILLHQYIFVGHRSVAIADFGASDGRLARVTRLSLQRRRWLGTDTVRGEFEHSTGR